ncbi:MAG: MqnA/MqnD/SBP family protein [Thermoplasmatales archaeon]
MEVMFPDIPEYRFILRGLCDNVFPAYPKFQCDSFDSREYNAESDIAFVSAPLAVIMMGKYLTLGAGAVFSYFSGPILINPDEKNTELYIRKEDFYSRHYARIFLGDVTLKEGEEGYPALLEPRLAIMSGPFPYPKVDLYSKWSALAGYLPLPLYCGIIKKDLMEVKGIVEEAIGASVKYALSNSDTLIKDIAHLHGMKNVDMLKRAILNFVNRNSLSMAPEELEALGVLRKEMVNRSIKVEDLLL